MQRLPWVLVPAWGGYAHEQQHAAYRVSRGATAQPTQRSCAHSDRAASLRPLAGGFCSQSELPSFRSGGKKRAPLFSTAGAKKTEALLSRWSDKSHGGTPRRAALDRVSLQSLTTLQR